MSFNGYSHRPRLVTYRHDDLPVPSIGLYVGPPKTGMFMTAVLSATGEFPWRRESEIDEIDAADAVSRIATLDCLRFPVFGWCLYDSSPDKDRWECRPVFNLVRGAYLGEITYARIPSFFGRPAFGDTQTESAQNWCARVLRRFPPNDLYQVVPLVPGVDHQPYEGRSGRPIDLYLAELTKAGCAR